MATMNVSLPDRMKDWAESKVESGQYANVSDYVRDLIRRDKSEWEKLESLRDALRIGRESGISKCTVSEVISKAKADIRDDAV
ncbi:MAG TPA: type II toxin-antitoxin system ParD family antitoxin [Thermodesulfovibrionia bacterium]|nr:type II toxin-antitoxin system ParD family antitoxin [Thermodesulfovibrionia bacterium]